MAGAIGTAFIEIRLDDRAARAGVKSIINSLKDVDQAADKAARGVADDFQDASRKAGRSVSKIGDDTRKTTRGIGSAFRGLGGIITGAFVGLGAISLFKGFIDQAEESIKVGRQTAAVLKSTGGAANVTAKQVDELATSLSIKAGIDDEVIASSENVLLTFRAVRNEAGKGNDIFTQGTKAALDLSVAMGTDLTSATVQVGKALNDPIKGMTALRRVGVTFTQQQVDQVKALVASGNQLGAQKLILRELSAEFGGSAAAQATASGKLRVAWENLQEELGKKLLPALVAFTDWAVTKGIPALTQLADWIQVHVVPAVQTLWHSFQDDLVPAFQRLIDIIGTVVIKLQGLAEALGLNNAWVRRLVVALGALTVAAGAVALVFGGFDAAGKAVATVLGLAGFAVTFLTTVLSPLIIAVASVIAGFKLAQAVIPIVAGFITGTVIPAVQAVTNALLTFWHAALEPVARVIFTVLRVALGVLVAFLIGPTIIAVATAIRIFQAFAGILRGPVTAAVNAVRAVVAAAFGVIRTVVIAAWNAIRAATVAAWGVIRAAVSAGVSVIRSVVSAGFNAITGVIRSAMSIAQGVVRSAVEAIKRPFGTIAGAVGRAMSGVAGIITAPFEIAAEVIRGIIRSILNAIGDIPGAIGRALSHLPGAGVVKNIVGAFPGFQEGGIEDFGAGTPAVLHGREAIVPLDNPRQAAGVLSQAGLGGVTVNVVNNWTGAFTPAQAVQLSRAATDGALQAVQRRRVHLNARAT